MANTRYSVPCPSCEASVPIKSTAQIGQKTECPKCKYRFTVPAPSEDEASADAAPAKGKKKDKKAAKKAKSGNSTVLIGVGVGVLAVGALVAAAVLLLGGDGDSGKTASGGGGGGGSVSRSAISGGGGTAASPDGGEPGPAGGTPDGGATPAGEGAKTSATAESKRPRGPESDVTNLLPNDTRAVYRVNMDRLGQNAAPLYTAVIDSSVRALVQNSLTLPPDQVQVYIHCVVDPDRDPFAVIRTKDSFDPAQIYRQLQLDKPENPGQVKRDYFIVKSNALIESLAKAFNTRSVLGLFGLPTALADGPPTRGTQANQPQKKYALCVYDPQTLLISTEGVMQRYLSDLTDAGYPPYKSDLTPADAAPPSTDPSAPQPGGEGGRVGPGGAASSGFSVDPNSFHPAMKLQQPGVQGGRGAMPDPRGQGQQRPGAGGPGGAMPDPRGGGGQQRPGGPGIPGEPQTQGGAQPGRPQRRVFTSVPTYRTIDPQLKRMLNDLESNDKEPPAVVYAELIDQRLLTARPIAQTFKELGPVFASLASQVRLIGATLTQFNKDKGIAKIDLEYVSDDDARRSVNEHILPLLNLVKLASDLTLNTQTTITNGAGGGQPGGDGAPGFPGGPGALAGGPGVASQGGGGSPDGDVAGGPGGEGGRRGGGPGGRGGFPGGPGGPGQFPGSAGAGGTPGAFGSQATYNVSVADKIVSIEADVNWPEDKYEKVLQPQVARIGGQIRGRMSVQSGQTDWYTLADTAGKLQRDRKPFPRGTLEREVREERYRLPFPPEQRVSFLAELLPYMGKAGLRSQLQDKKIPWYHKDNLAAAETWVPEFLVPYYPQEAWRAHHPLAEGRTLGATNFVAPAGLGLDAGRFDPANPDHAKKVGITGYDWGSNPAEVKDGLSNTIYLIQAPPTAVGPWAAGGGSSVRGVRDTGDSMADFVHRAPDGRRGTYILMADGSVRWLKEGTDPAIFRGLVTRGGGESLGDLDKLAPKVKRTATANEGELRGNVPADRPTPPAAKSSAGVDQAELKKFQGKWKVTFAFIQGVIVPPDALAKLNIEVSFDGLTSTAKVAGKTETATITALDPAAKPARMTMFDKDKNETETSIYEFVGPDKFKVRASKQAKDLPNSVAIPTAGTKDVTYFELERVK